MYFQFWQFVHLIWNKSAYQKYERLKSPMNICSVAMEAEMNVRLLTPITYTA